MISFFEEFPTEENLEKLGLIDFSTKLYLASPSIKEFEKIRIGSRYVKEKVWWPVLKKEEGYWLSPFSKKEALERIVNEAMDSEANILWDAKLPLNRRILNPNFVRNLYLIKRFFKKFGNKIYTAEYFKKSLCSKTICLSFDPRKYNNGVIKMYYSSMLKIPQSRVRKKIEEYSYMYSDNLVIGLGCIAIGILGRERLLTPKELENDLRLCKDVNEIVIFRLGGLNQEYLDVIKEFNQ